MRCLEGDVRVKDLIDLDNKQWNLNFLNEILSEPKFDTISRIPISICNSPDRLLGGVLQIASSLSEVLIIFNMNC